LKEESNFAASYGSIVHAVFEVMNRKYLNSYNLETALSLGETLFSIGLIELDDVIDEKLIEFEQNAINKGFSQNDIELVKASDRLSLAEMQDKFQNALKEFDCLGYFSNPPQKAVCEIPFSFSIPEIKNVVFDGRIDALLMGDDGKYTVVDYKTGKNKVNTLDYAISDNGVAFLTKSGKQPANVATLQKAYDYQIPLYYLACKYSDVLSVYREKLAQLGLLYVRPSYIDGGCIEDFVAADKLEVYSDKIVQNLKETVIDKIQNEKEFKPEKTFACSFCSYKYLCDEVIDDE
jgi:ATP-dependent exoDNAse (exonuclease V) beta subunit